ncbi:hypothetical protein DFJ58DRAFT_841372 [Suillus subalutaceus]|uniref:uncharacterized protein n=1 Tax=Suillus subalutaceus TaxID=48586 RepID=UPI001B8784CA|nr:uncharacterized protein DFJ58DRAFT_841372 [Suillus subalutaceus]KAG1854457.1 hypothetical protein DFJ58DRAFT_841372 [Suillus subalutaceus]
MSTDTIPLTSAHAERTRFRVSRTDSSTAGTVIVGSDEIGITLTTANLSVNIIDTTGQVILSSAPKSGLKFSSLLGKFNVGSTLYKDSQGSDMKELIYTDDGEEWELV